MKIKKIILTVITVFLSVISCSEDGFDLVDPNVIVPTTFFQNSTELASATNASYSFLQAQGLYGRLAFFLFDNLSQENQGSDALLGPLRTWLEYSFDPSLGEFNLIWQTMYRGIGSCNFVIQSAENGLIKNVSDTEINARLGEVRFLRALYYFNLTNLFGGVPLVTVPATDTSGAPRATQEAVYDLILEDLAFAVENLPDVSTADQGRATRGAAQALLGKTFLFLERFQDARDQFAAITGYTIEGVEPRDNGNEAGEFNAESIFEVTFDQAIGGAQWNPVGSGVAETTFRGIEYSPVNFANVVIAPSIFAEFEDNDPRIAAYFYQNGDSFNNGELTFSGLGNPVWRKYQNLDVQATDGFDYSGINFRVIRYADVLLMWAEAENELGNGPAAISLMNQVRARVSMPFYGTPEMDAAGFPVGSQAEIFDALVHERAVELAGEQVRYFDLQRWDLAASVLDGFVVGKHEFLPIPQGAIDGNPQLTNADQNPGY